MGAVLTLGLKDLRVLLRDRFGLFWIFAFPLMYALFFGTIFSGQSGGNRAEMPIVVIDEDNTDASRSLTQRLGDHESLWVTPARTSTAGDSDPASLVRRGRKVAFLRIKQGFGASPFAFFGAGSDAPLLEVGIDPARGAEAGYLQGILMETVFKGITERIRDPGTMRQDLVQARREIAAAKDIAGAQKLVLQTLLKAPDAFYENAEPEVLTDGPASLGDNAIRIVDVARDSSGSPRSAFEVTFPSAIVWGLVGCAAAFAIAIVRERTAGTLLRLRVAPIGRAHVLAGKGLACFLACTATIVTILMIGRLALGVRITSPVLLGLAIACTAACFTGIMMAMSVLGKTEQAVAGAGWGIMLPLAMIGGGMVPLIAMPSWMLTASSLSPFKWSILALEGAIWRGFGWSEMLMPCGILIAVGVVFFALGVMVFARSE